MRWTKEPEKFLLRKALIRSVLDCIYYFWENNTDALVIPKRHELPKDDRTNTNLKAPLKTNF